MQPANPLFRFDHFSAITGKNWDENRLRQFDRDAILNRDLSAPERSRGPNVIRFEWLERSRTGRRCGRHCAHLARGGRRYDLVTPRLRTWCARAMRTIGHGFRFSGGCIARRVIVRAIDIATIPPQSSAVICRRIWPTIAGSTRSVALLVSPKLSIARAALPIFSPRSVRPARARPPASSIPSPVEVSCGAASCPCWTRCSCFDHS